MVKHAYYGKRHKPHTNLATPIRYHDLWHWHFSVSVQITLEWGEDGGCNLIPNAPVPDF